MVVRENTCRLAPSIRPFVEELFTSGLFSEHHLDIVNPLSGCPSHETDNNTVLCDRFKLILPFAGYYVAWEVIFDGTCPDVAPDFIFDDDSFLCKCDLESIPSLINWDASNEKSFVNVISELLKLYSKFQWEDAEKNVSSSILKWLDLENVEKEGLKVQILNGSQKGSPYLTTSRQKNILQNGNISIVVEVPVASELDDSENMQFSLQYIFKSHSSMYEENITCSPALAAWLQPHSDVIFKRRTKWTNDSKAFSVAVQSYNRDISELFKKCVQDYKDRQKLQFSLLQHILSKTDLKPSLLEFDYNEFQYSSYLLLNKTLFSVEYLRGSPKGRLLKINDDCTHKLVTEFSGDHLSKPDFDIAHALPEFAP